MRRMALLSLALVAAAGLLVTRSHRVPTATAKGPSVSPGEGAGLRQAIERLELHPNLTSQPVMQGVTASQSAREPAPEGDAWGPQGLGARWTREWVGDFPDTAPLTY